MSNPKETKETAVGEIEDPAVETGEHVSPRLRPVRRNEVRGPLPALEEVVPANKPDPH